MPPPKLPPKTPNQVWAEHQRRITAAEGVPTFVQVLSHDYPNDPHPFHSQVPHKDHELTPKTKVALSLAAWGSVIATVFTFGISLGLKGGRILDKQDAIDIKLTQVLTKQDLLDVKRELGAAFVAQVRRGEVYADCPTILKKGVDLHRCQLGGLILPDFPPLQKDEER